MKKTSKIKDVKDTKRSFESITKDMNELYVRKNKDYGNSFDKGCDERGPASAIDRLYDKLGRVKAITKNKTIEVIDEKIGDTLMDLANYAVMFDSWSSTKQKFKANKELRILLKEIATDSVLLKMWLEKNKKINEN